MRMKPVPAKISRQITLVAVPLYAIFALFSQLIIPERFTFDTQNMVDVAENIIAGGDASLNVIASLIRVFSLPGLNLIIGALGVGIIFYVLSGRRTVFSLSVALFSIAIVIPLSLVRPQKEFLVLLLTCSCVWVISHFKKQGWALFWIFALYGLYTAVSLRPYYALIAALIPVLYFFASLSNRSKLLVVLLVFLAGFFLPSQALELLKAARDAVNELRVLYPELEGNRTAFSNPIQSVGWLGFLGNYAYAIVRLNLPILFSQAANELVLTFFAMLWLYVIWLAGKIGDWRARFAARLMMSHLLVLWIFEPDLGSYLRHFSSCIVYLVPMLRAIEARGIASWSSRVQALSFNKPAMSGG